MFVVADNINTSVLLFRGPPLWSAMRAPWKVTDTWVISLGKGLPGIVLVPFSCPKSVKILLCDLYLLNKYTYLYMCIYIYICVCVSALWAIMISHIWVRSKAGSLKLSWVWRSRVRTGSAPRGFNQLLGHGLKSTSNIPGVPNIFFMIQDEGGLGHRKDDQIRPSTTTAPSSKARTYVSKPT